MTDLMDLLTAIPNHNGDPLYSVDDLRKHATIVINLEGGGLLAVRDVDGGYPVSFVVTEFSQGPATKDGAVVDPELHERVFHGWGPSDGLRELRHTFWGEPNNSGYIFYPNAKLIADAFRQLRRWFDCE